VAEERLLARVTLLLMIVTATVLISSLIALGSTMAASVIDRSEEIGLMSSLGALPRQVRSFFIAEAGAAGIAGSIAGYLAGTVAAEAVAVTAFGGTVPVSLAAFPLTLLLGTGIAAGAASVPVRRALRTEPAAVLRGE
jgi:ABC-type antimicrobial peptide transport system permease subunit